MSSPIRDALKRRLPFVLSLTLLLAACDGGMPDDDSKAGSGGSETPTATPDPAVAPRSASAVSPVQPDSGFGGTGDYRYASTTANMYGLGATAYWLVMPEGAGNVKLPVVYFLHGYGSSYVAPYRSWIDHIVKRGAIVIYPAYQVSTLTPLSTYVANALAGIRAAFMQLDSSVGPVPDRTRVMAIGHSIGGVIAINLTATAAADGIPQPRALMAVSPTEFASDKSRSIPVANLGDIPNGTQLLALYSDQDANVDNSLARKLYNESTNVPVADKEYLVLRSDAHGPVGLVADHFAALAGNDGMISLYVPDALDFFGFWRLSAALMDSATGNIKGGRAVALGHGSDMQRNMGIWSDGVAVIRPTVTASP